MLCPKTCHFYVVLALFSAFWTYIHSIVWFMSRNFTFFGHKVRFSDLICPKIADIAFGIWLFWTYGRILLKICPKGSCERPLSVVLGEVLARDQCV